MVRILHTSDWQLGMTRWFLYGDAQARYADDQIRTLGTLSALARDRSCDAVVVAGDVFDSLVPPRKTVTRALEAFEQFSTPVYLVPGNHDPSSQESVWQSGRLAERLPPLVTLVTDSTPVRVNDSLEVLGVPWTTKRPDHDLVTDAVKGCSVPRRGVSRVLIGHGAVDEISPDRDSVSVIHLEDIRRALQEGVIHYVALGDRHSFLDVGGLGRVWYSGAPMMTNFREQLLATNRALVVDVTESEVHVEPVVVGEWNFHRIEIAASGSDLLQGVRAELSRHGDRSRTAVRLVLTGTLSLAERGALDELIDKESDRYASIELSREHGDLAVVVAQEDLSTLSLGGYGEGVVRELASLVERGGEIGEDAVGALSILYRLTESRK